MPFEKFDRRVRNFRDEKRAMVGITRAGRFTFNRMALTALRDADAVTLHFDPEARLVGIAHAETGDPTAYTLVKGSSGQRYVSANNFLRHYDVSLEKASRYPARYDGGMLVVELKDRPGVKEKVLGEIEAEDRARGIRRAG